MYGRISMVILAFSSDLIVIVCQEILQQNQTTMTCLPILSSIVSHAHQHHFQTWQYNSSFQNWYRQKHPLNTQEPLFPPVLSSPLSDCHLERHLRHFTCVSALLTHGVTRPRLSKCHWMRAMTPMPDWWLSMCCALDNLRSELDKFHQKSMHLLCKK